MGKSTNKAFVVLGMSTLLTFVGVLACLACLDLRSEPATTLNLAGLESAHVAPMSCDDQPDFQGGALLWCADPDSPQCMPALPSVPQVELWDGPPACAFAQPVTPPRVAQLMIGWQRPRPGVNRSRHAQGRLERPPRA